MGWLGWPVATTLVHINFFERVVSEKNALTDFFTIDFKVNKPNVVLPTQPIIRLIKIKGDQRIDNPIEFDNSTFYQFTVVESGSEKLEADNFPECKDGCKDFVKLEKMGINHPDWYSDGVYQSDGDKKMGDVYGEAFTIYVPIIDYLEDGM